MMKRIVLAIPHRGHQPDITADLCKWTNVFKKVPGYTHTQGFFTGQPVDAVRNGIVKTFLKYDDAEWLVMIDSDCVPPDNGLEIVQHKDAKIVSGIVFSAQNGIPFPLIQVERVDNKFGMMTLEELDLRTKGRLIKVDGIGFGFAAIHREVLEAMEPPWFKFQYRPNGQIDCSEDYYFSKKAIEAGYDLYVDKEISVGHIKAWDCKHINKMFYKMALLGPKAINAKIEQQNELIALNHSGPADKMIDIDLIEEKERKRVL